MSKNPRLGHWGPKLGTWPDRELKMDGELQGSVDRRVERCLEVCESLEARIHAQDPFEVEVSPGGVSPHPLCDWISAAWQACGAAWLVVDLSPPTSWHKSVQQRSLRRRSVQLSRDSAKHSD